jgi:hypothetical protein
MADIRAILNNSDFSLSDTWFGNVVPGPGDVAFVNGNTVLVSDARTVQAISNAAGTEIVAGGTFSLLNGCNLEATNPNGVIQGTVGSCVTTSSLGVGDTAVLIASAVGSSSATSAVTHSGSGILSLIGNYSGSAISGNSNALLVNGVGTLNLTGNTIGGSSQSFGGTGYSINVTGAATVNITGNITGGGGSANSLGLILSNAAANVTVTGNLLGGSAAVAFINNGGTFTHTGICQSSANSPAVGLGVVSQITRLSGPFLVGPSNNVTPVVAISIRRAPSLIPTYWQIPQADGSTMTELSSGDRPGGGNYPVASNVVSPTVYGRDNEFTGTAAMPSPSSVAQGVPVGATVGTAVLTGANVLAALGMAENNLDAQLTEKATVNQVASMVQAVTST